MSVPSLVDKQESPSVASLDRCERHVEKWERCCLDHGSQRHFGHQDVKMPSPERRTVATASLLDHSCRRQGGMPTLT